MAAWAPLNNNTSLLLFLNASVLSALYKLPDIIQHPYKVDTIYKLSNRECNLPKFSQSVNGRIRHGARYLVTKLKALDCYPEIPHLGFGKHTTSPECEYFHTALDFLPSCPIYQITLLL